RLVGSGHRDKPAAFRGRLARDLHAQKYFGCDDAAERLGRNCAPLQLSTLALAALGGSGDLNWCNDRCRLEVSYIGGIWYCDRRGPPLDRPISSGVPVARVVAGRCSPRLGRVQRSVVVEPARTRRHTEWPRRTMVGHLGRTSGSLAAG